MECEHDNSARCESPPVNDTVYWSQPTESALWVCEKCKQKSDVVPALFRVCKSCYYKKCHGCYYGVENTRDADKAAAAGKSTLKRKMSESGEEGGGGSSMKRAAGGVGGASAADKAAADKAAADKAAAIVIDLSEVASSTGYLFNRWLFNR